MTSTTDLKDKARFILFLTILFFKKLIIPHRAILQDSKDWTFPLNRAAAYLKLAKNEDAERDCTTVLTLNASNVKALFRRAQARRALDKLIDAQKDLEQATLLDPSNEPVKNELNAVKDILWKKSTSDVVHPLRRRVPIQIIEPPNSHTTETSVSVPKSAKPKSSPSSLSSPSPPASDPNTTQSSARAEALPAKSSSSQEPSTSFQEAKRAREENSTKVSRVGGGIFRASGKNTIFPERTSSNGRTTSTTPVDGASSDHSKENADTPNWGATVELGNATVSLFEFTKGWNRLSGASVEDRLRYITTIAPSSYPNMFQNSLEPPLLTGIIKTLRSALDENGVSNPIGEKENPAHVNLISISACILRAFFDVRRIRTVMMFLSRTEREMIRKLVEQVFTVGQVGEKGAEAWKNMLK
ncbi:hypothetical protein BDP27DRAFT_1444204 [Rhodocollybia butyracea]|uniref:RNA polymerase II-associated protein 3 n=1 Tax=Rhodocollybia butyracea TaxID=206335 RepID=A0A9P5PXL2_9AGAR|nr:hypothetical protein BDP27DRAFT_1444204 [Rhodocollybia butyracea]